MMTLRRSARLTSVLNNKVLPPQPPSPPKRSSRPQSSSRVNKAKSRSRKQINDLKISVEQLPLDVTLPDTGTIPVSNDNAETDNIFDLISTDRPSRLHATPPPLDRPVEPHRTNAALLTPHGSSLVAYPPGSESLSPSKTGRPRPTATTGTLLEKAVAHLIATDARLEPLIRRHPCPLFSPEGLAEEIDPFRSLVSSIIGQQVSGAAARSIKDKFVALFNRENDGQDPAKPRRFPTPEEVAQYDLATLRTAGLSQRKAEYIHGLSQKFATGELSARMLLNASDEELMEKLTAVRGLGRWSVEMFACFALKRIDVFSTGDLGVQRGCAAFMGKDVSKLKAKGGGKFKYMAEKDMLELAAKFAPYR
jgi:DNA-3-methyladenine glycosylase II